MPIQQIRTLRAHGQDVSLVHWTCEWLSSHPHREQFNRPPLTAHWAATVWLSPRQAQRDKRRTGYTACPDASLANLSERSSDPILPPLPVVLNKIQAPCWRCCDSHERPRLPTAGPLHLLYPLLKYSSPDPHKASSSISVASSERHSLTALSKVGPCLTAASPQPIFILALVTSEGAVVTAGLFVYCQPAPTPPRPRTLSFRRAEATVKCPRTVRGTELMLSSVERVAEFTVYSGQENHGQKGQILHLWANQVPWEQ